MKSLKIIGVIFLVFAVLIVFLGIIAPKDYHVTRNTSINAPVEIVFQKIKYWNNWGFWSPWAEKDPTMIITVEGVDGEIGSTYTWTGDSKITGSGQMTTKGIVENEEIIYHLHFKEPWDSESDGYVRIKQVGDKTAAVWGFYGRNTFPWNIMSLFVSMEDMMKEDFDRGLELLKQISEDEYGELGKYPVYELDFPRSEYIGVRAKVPMQEISSFFSTSFGVIQEVMSKTQTLIAGPPVGLYYEWDESAMITDMAAALPVKRSIGTSDVKAITIPAGKAYVVEYYGPYEGIREAYAALHMYFSVNDLKFSPPVLEAYITDPGSEPDPKKWLTRVHFFSR